MSKAKYTVPVEGCPPHLYLSAGLVGDAGVCGDAPRPSLKTSELTVSEISPAELRPREVFHVCLSMYRHLAFAGSGRQGALQGDALRGFSRPREEYIADFELVTRRHLGDVGWAEFRRLYLSPGVHFVPGWGHRAVEAQLGHVYAELKPYGLYPLRGYFARIGSAVLMYRCSAAG